ncbi:hypothetical protein [Frankia tisae]|nr:hypothetical protein [Frankia tisae]
MRLAPETARKQRSGLDLPGQISGIIVLAVLAVLAAGVASTVPAQGH